MIKNKFSALNNVLGKASALLNENALKEENHVTPVSRLIKNIHNI